jgi:hypothetical protein
MLHILADYQPLFMPAGELMGESVTADYLHTIFLPEVCNLLTGMCWPLDVGF